MMKDGLFMSVASYDNLNLAWKSILSKESAGGIDNTSPYFLEGSPFQVILSSTVPRMA